jgi:CobQ-like glutamine amidotransferase family enzyme
MVIYIAHLYYDLMNLYGEIGNVKVLVNTIEKQGIKVVVDRLSINDKIDFNKYDLIYIGCGTEDNQLLVLKDIIKYKNKIKEYIENNKFILSTGNSYELFGKSIYDGKNKHTGLGIFDYNAKNINNRIVGDIIVKSNLIKSKIIGFQNQGSNIFENNNNMFDIVLGNENKNEGINYKNFYGTYMLGPILVRNPEFNEYIVTKLIRNKYNDFKVKKINNKLDNESYKEYLINYHKDIID